MFLITDVKLLKLLSVVCGFGTQTYICKNYIQNICSALISTNLSVNKHGSSYKSFIFHFTGIKSGLMVVDHTFAMPYATPSEDNYSSEEELKEIINEQVRQ